MPKLRSLNQRLAEMREPPSDPSSLFHAVTLTADDNGLVTFGMHTKWVGYDDSDRRIELRQSRLVYSSYGESWTEIGLPYVIVLDGEDLAVFLLSGGNALIERSVAESAFPFLLQPRPSYLVGRAGYVGGGLLAPTALRRAPTPKLRMAVLKRDRRRCRICGRNPDDNTDLVLHVHHIRPWEDGGITDMSNLIALCHTCHSGLDPHHDTCLYQYVEPNDAISTLENFQKGVANYRRAGMLSFRAGIANAS